MACGVNEALYYVKTIMDLATDLPHEWALSNSLQNTYSVSKFTE
jgi:hypothetical protein